MGSRSLDYMTASNSAPRASARKLAALDGDT
jgi:hypothetical protein